MRATAILDRFMCINDQVVRLIRNSNSILSEKMKLYAYHFRDDKPFCEEIDSDNRESYLISTEGEMKKTRDVARVMAV